MGQAKRRGTFEERKAQAIAAGRSHREVKAQREATKMAKYKQKELVRQLTLSLIYGQYR